MLSFTKEAYEFINYILRPDVIARISNKIGYPNPNKDAFALVNESIRKNPNMYVPDEARRHPCQGWGIRFCY